MALNKAKEIVSPTPVVVFSKTYCGYCNRVKQLLTQLGAAYNAIELDEERDGYEIQSAPAVWTRQRTVPNVFIGGKHIGGCDEALEMHQSGTLKPLLMDAGAIANNSAQLNIIKSSLSLLPHRPCCHTIHRDETLVLCSYSCFCIM